MFLRETLLLRNSAEGMVFSTGLASWARIAVLLVALGFFILTLSSEFAYDPRFRISVIILAIFLGVFVGPRTEVLLIRSEKKLQITRRFFLFARTKGCDLNGSEEIEAVGKKIFLKAGGISFCLASARKDAELALWIEGVERCLERMRDSV